MRRARTGAADGDDRPLALAAGTRFADIFDAVLGAGLPAFQLRVKDAPDRALERLARDAVARCRAASRWWR